MLMANIDGDKAVAWGKGMFNLPQSIFRPVAEVKTLRQQSAQAAQQKQMAETAVPAAKAIKDVSLSAEPIQAMLEAQG